MGVQVQVPKYFLGADREFLQLLLSGVLFDGMLADSGKCAQRPNCPREGISVMNYSIPRVKFTPQRDELDWNFGNK